MTAPAAPPAAPDVAAWRAEHAWWHGEFIDHERACPGCQSGQRCRSASYLADMADDYGKRWRLAEQRRAAANRRQV